MLWLVTSPYIRTSSHQKEYLQSLVWDSLVKFGMTVAEGLLYCGVGCSSSYVRSIRRILRT